MASTTTDRRLGLNTSSAIKVPCKAATTANVTLSGEQTIDGVACVTNDRILVKNQTTASENGIYLCNTSSWSRDKDWDGSLEVKKGTLIYVTSGSTNTGFWYVTTSDPIIPGTTSVTIAGASTVLATVSAFIQTMLDDADAATARTTIGAVGLTNNETITGTKTLSGNNTHSGTNTFSAANTFSGANSFTTARQNFYVDASNSAIRIGSSSTNNGGYLTSVAGDSVYLSGGAEYSAATWIARATEAGILSIATDGALRYEYNSGLVAGNTYTPTSRFTVDSAGTVVVGTVPLARMTSTTTSGTATISANSEAPINLAFDSAHDYFLWSVYDNGSDGSNIAVHYGANVNGLEAVQASLHARLSRDYDAALRRSYLNLVNGTAAVETMAYSVLLLVES